jgi:hypothetical protein
VTADDPDTADFGAGVPARGGQRVGVDVIDLPVTRGARDIDQFSTDRHDRHPRARVHEDPFPADRRKQTHLGSADDGSGPHGDITGLYIVPGAAHVRTRGDPAVDPHA